MKLECPPPVRGTIGRRLVRQHAGKEQRPTGRQLHRHPPRGVQPVRHNLAVAVMMMAARARFVFAHQQVHAAVGDSGIVERDPDAQDGFQRQDGKVGVVLMPRFLAADERRFDKRHVLKQDRPGAE